MPNIDVIEFFGIYRSALDRFLGGDSAQFLRGEIFEFSAIAPKGSARAADYGDIAGFEHESLAGSSSLAVGALGGE